MFTSGLIWILSNVFAVLLVRSWNPALQSAFAFSVKRQEPAPNRQAETAVRAPLRPASLRRFEPRDPGSSPAPPVRAPLRHAAPPLPSSGTGATVPTRTHARPRPTETGCGQEKGLAGS